MSTGMTIHSSRDVALRAAHFCTENCTESGKSAQFQPISYASKFCKSNRYDAIWGSIPTRASSFFDFLSSAASRREICVALEPRRLTANACSEHVRTLDGKSTMQASGRALALLSRRLNAKKAIVFICRRLLICRVRLCLTAASRPG